MTTIPFLDLDQIEIDRKVGRLLPPEIAYRYHALPIASDGNQVTIAMACPEDPTACKIVKSLIEAPVFLIQADNDEIDYLLHQLWPQESSRLKFLFWSLSENKDLALDFTKGIARSLGAELEQIESKFDGEHFYEDLACCLKTWRTDLIVLQALDAFQMLRELEKHLRLYSLPDILILPPVPKGPLHKLLIVADGKLGCGAGVTWALRLSEIDDVAVNMLPVLPPVPPCYGSLLFHDLAVIKAGNDPLGKDLRSQSKRLKEKDIKVICTLRCGDTYDQISQEINSAQPDLLILPAISAKGKVEWGSIEMIQILYKYISQPILITH